MAVVVEVFVCFSTHKLPSLRIRVLVHAVPKAVYAIALRFACSNAAIPCESSVGLRVCSSPVVAETASVRFDQFPWQPLHDAFGSTVAPVPFDAPAAIESRRPLYAWGALYVPSCH